MRRDAPAGAGSAAVESAGMQSSKRTERLRTKEEAP